MSLLLVTVACSRSNLHGFRFVFISDVHYTGERGAPQGLAQAIQLINTLNPRPDFVISGGDGIMDALEASEGAADSAYTAFLAALDALEMPVYHTIGNHEYFGVYESSGISPEHPRYGNVMFTERTGYARPYHAFTHRGWLFIMLNSIAVTADRGYTGHIDSTQLSWLQATLSKHGTEKPVVIASHMPFYSIAAQMVNGPMTANEAWAVVGNAPEVMAVLAPYNCRLVLQGHLHIQESMRWKETEFITGGAVCAAWWTGPNMGFEEGFVVVDVKENDYSWEYIDYGWEALSE